MIDDLQKKCPQKRHGFVIPNQLSNQSELSISYKPFDRKSMHGKKQLHFYKCNFFQIKW